MKLKKGGGRGEEKQKGEKKQKRDTDDEGVRVLRGESFFPDESIVVMHRYHALFPIRPLNENLVP